MLLAVDPGPRVLDEPLHFDGTRYLADVFEAAAFVEPRLLLLDHPRPCEARKARFVRSDPLLDYARGWDQFGKLVLSRPSETGEPYGLIAAWKSEEVDRIVSDRRRQNAREAFLGGESFSMTCGPDLAELESPPAPTMPRSRQVSHWSRCPATSAT